MQAKTHVTPDKAVKRVDPATGQRRNVIYSYLFSDGPEIHRKTAPPLMGGRVVPETRPPSNFKHSLGVGEFARPAYN